MKIRASLRYMAANEIASMIDPARLREIKLQDPKPVFKAFVVGHEGEASGYMVGVGNIVKRWFRSAIEILSSKISVGLQLFHGHSDTNETEGRQTVGEVVGKKVMRIQNRVAAVVACYIFPSFRHLPFDVASIEAEVDLEESKDGLYVAEVGKVTAIALGNSAINKPGFPGATLLGQLQAFAKSKNIGDDDMGLSIEDVRSFLKTEQVKPSDVFGMDELAADPAVKGLAEDRVKERVAGEWRGRKEAEEKLEKERAERKEREAALLLENRGLKVANAKTQVGPLFEKAKVERKLTDQQTQFITTRMERFTPKEADSLEKDFAAYLDSEVDEYGKIAKVFGVGVEKGNGKPAGGEPDESKAAATDSPYTDPARNPMIKVG